MGSRLDVVLIHPGDKRQVYQGLGAELAGVEPPYWAGALASYLRRRGIRVAMLDANAENLSSEEAADEVARLDPRFAAVFASGAQPSASTQTMPAAGRICRSLRDRTSCRVVLGGLHPSALPERTLREEAVDYVVKGEGFRTLEQLALAVRAGDVAPSSIPGLWYRAGEEVRAAPPAALLTAFDEGFDRAAWDLLPMARYRAHNWHCFGRLDQRGPYAAVQTSFGCPYGCVFCCVNALFGERGIRYRSPRAVVEEIAFLVEGYGVRNLKIIDELFVFDERHYLPIVDALAERDYGLNIWAYARVDTVKREYLERLRRAGVTWLALGIETANAGVRNGVAKRGGAVDVRRVVEDIRAAGIHVIGNYIFGLPEDTSETLGETLDLALELNCEFANFYCAMAYPGSALYDRARREGWRLPENWQGYSQHSYETTPLPTRHISAAEVLRFRDDAFQRYFQDERYLTRLEGVFGAATRGHVEQMASLPLRRRLLETVKPSSTLAG